MWTDASFAVYIMANHSGTLYIGMTNDLWRRVWEHKQGTHDGFTKKYVCTKLIYHEETPYVLNAIYRETEMKKWRREKKVALIRDMNPKWEDLAMKWYVDGVPENAYSGPHASERGSSAVCRPRNDKSGGFIIQSQVLDRMSIP